MKPLRHAGRLAVRIAITLAVLPLHANLSLAAPQAGVAAAVRGRVTLDRTQAIGMIVESGTEIELGDKIETGPDGSLQILLLDETVFTVGPKSQMVIDTFVYDPATGNGELDAELVKGAFRFLSGRIAKRDPEKMKVRLPAGTIGIRGTLVGANVDDRTGRSLVMLAGPGSGNSAGVPPGSIIVENAGVPRDVMRAGWGVEVPDFHTPPTEPFRVPIELYGAFEVAAPGSGGAGPAGGGRPKPRGARSGGRSGARASGDDGADPAESSDGDELGSGEDGGAFAEPDGGALEPSDAAGQMIDEGSAEAFFQDSFDGQTELFGDITQDQSQDSFPTQQVDMATTVMDLVDLSGTFNGHYLYEFFNRPTVSGGNLDLIIDLDFSVNMIGVQVIDVASQSLGTSGFGSGATSVPFTSNVSDVADYNVEFPYFESAICMPCPTTVAFGFDNTTDQIAGIVFAEVLVVSGTNSNISDGTTIEPSPITQIQP